MGLLDNLKKLTGLGGTGLAGRRVRATWQGAVLAETDESLVVEGNHYFPPESVERRYLQPSSTHTVCGWKGLASYYDVVVDGRVNRDAAWYYADPKPGASHVANRIAFWHGVRVEPVPLAQTDETSARGAPVRRDSLAGPGLP